MCCVCVCVWIHALENLHHFNEMGFSHIEKKEEEENNISNSLVLKISLFLASKLFSLSIWLLCMWLPMQHFLHLFPSPSTVDSISMKRKGIKKSIHECSSIC